MNLLGTVIVLAMLIPLISLYGAAGAAIAVLAGGLGTLPLLVWFTVKVLKGTVVELGRSMLPAVWLSAVVAIAIVVSRSVLGHIGLPEFGAMMVLVGASYLAASVFLFLLFHSGPFKLLTLLRPRL